MNNRPQPPRRAAWASGLLLALAFAAKPLAAEELKKDGTPAAPPKAGFAGAETCLNCHEDKKGFERTFHGRKSLSSPKLTESCESCHGPGQAHADAGGDASKIISPKKLDAAGVSEFCFKCHADKKLMMWGTSHHNQSGLTCLKCHSVHDGNGRQSLKKGAVFDEKSQTETCLQCHKKQKADMRLASHHPIPEGKMACVSCHNPHGGLTGNHNADSEEELCARCHAEKAGPYANEHPPVSDSCMNCHKPHGSPNDKLLKQAQPYLCLGCHKFPHTTTQNGFTGVAVSREEQRGNCVDCHKEIHGSDRKRRLKD